MKKVSLLVFLIVWMFFTSLNLSHAQTIACTQEAKLCPDGKTWVSRTVLPNCDFAACPWEVITMCPVHDLMVPREWCDYEFYKDRNGCEIPKLVCDPSVCPVAWAPYCEYWFKTLGTKNVNWCEFPEFECNDEPKICTKEYMPVCGQPKWNCNDIWTATVCTQVYNLPKTYGNKCEMEAAGASFLYSWECRTTNLSKTDLSIGYTTVPNLTKLQKWESFSASTKATVRWMNIGVEIPSSIELQDKNWKTLEKCVVETNTTKDTTDNGSEAIGIKCAFQNAFQNREPNGETYILRTWVDYNNSIKEKNENNNIRERRVIIGKKERICPVADPAPGCKIESYKYVNGCRVPDKVVCDDDSDLSPQLKARADQVIAKFAARLEALDVSNSEKITKIESIISRLNALYGPDKSQTVNSLIKYLIIKLEEIQEKYEEDIDNIFDIFN